MSTVKFACSHCQKPMAVSGEFAGRKVRCPHCQSVVVAPGEATDAAPDPGAFDFAPPPREDGDSIFAEAADDGDVFGTVAPPAPQLDADLRPEAATHNLATSVSVTPQKTATPPEPGDEAPQRIVAKQPLLDAGRLQMLLIFLVPYAVTMTVLTLVYYFKYLNQLSQHPLSQIPDIGEFKTSTKRGLQTGYLPVGTQPLPPGLHVPLGGKLTVGDLQVEPVKLEQRPAVGYTLRKGRDEPEKTPFRNPSLILTLKLTNVSRDWTFVPTDPVFDRRPATAGSAAGRFHKLDIGGHLFQGGIIDYKADTGVVVREYIDGQENDTTPLKPGESRTTVVVTHPDEPIIAALAKAPNRAVWRVNLRRGPVTFRGEEVPTSAVFGVEFGKADVKNFIASAAKTEPKTVEEPKKADGKKSDKKASPKQK